MAGKHLSDSKIYREASVIIPVFNQWDLTRACLRALASTIKGKPVEVIVIDNASTDVTPDVCPLLGKKLFGEYFHYIRCPINKNFGPASNIGAKMATGEFLIFLNNDTVPLPGWYEPLVSDFSTYPHIAATGPLLIYPEREPFGHTVQHLGVYVTPLCGLGHLYEGISAESPLAKKRRFFQIITGACMVIRRELFIRAGMFDENFINGLEDVELCLRIRLMNPQFMMTVNPESRVIHHTSQTPGRHLHGEKNHHYFLQKCRGKYVPDWHIHLKNDGMLLKVGQWLKHYGTLPPEQIRRLDTVSATATYDDLANLLTLHPLWENGWKRLIKLCPSSEVRKQLQHLFFQLYPAGDKALEFHNTALEEQDIKQETAWLKSALSFYKSPKEYSTIASNSRQWCSTIGLIDIVSEYDKWLADEDHFYTEKLKPFLQNLQHISAKFGEQHKE